MSEKLILHLCLKSHCEAEFTVNKRTRHKNQSGLKVRLKVKRSNKSIKYNIK